MQPLLHFCLLAPVSASERKTGTVFGILAEKEPGSIVRCPARELDIPTTGYEDESLGEQPNNQGLREGDPAEMTLHAEPWMGVGQARRI